jgi:predicted DNA-binding transcriptional regulator YafY
MNESIYYNIDKIHAAISQGKKVTFKYFEWVVHFNGSEKFKKQYRKNGHPYEVSPWALTWDNENYYLVAYDTETDRIKHYRVDKMYDIGVSEAKRDGQTQFKSFDMAVYSKGIFGMFSGGIETVKMQFANHLVGVVLDRFGREVFINQVDDEHFAIVVKVAVSPQFLSWVFGFGKDIKIISPQTVVDRFKQQINESLNQYE